MQPTVSKHWWELQPGKWSYFFLTHSREGTPHPWLCLCSDSTPVSVTWTSYTNNTSHLTFQHSCVNTLYLQSNHCTKNQKDHIHILTSSCKLTQFTSSWPVAVEKLPTLPSCGWLVNSTTRTSMHGVGKSKPDETICYSWNTHNLYYQFPDKQPLASWPLDYLFPGMMKEDLWT